MATIREKLPNVSCNLNNKDILEKMEGACSEIVISSPLGIIFVSTRALKCGTLKAFPNITYENLVAICHACTVITTYFTKNKKNA